MNKERERTKMKTYIMPAIEQLLEKCIIIIFILERPIPSASVLYSLIFSYLQKCYRKINAYTQCNYHTRQFGKKLSLPIPSFSILITDIPHFLEQAPNFRISAPTPYILRAEEKIGIDLNLFLC